MFANTHTHTHTPSSCLWMFDLLTVCHMSPTKKARYKDSTPDAYASIHSGEEEVACSYVSNVSLQLPMEISILVPSRITLGNHDYFGFHFA